MNRDTILIVDDMEINRAILRNLFEQEYNLLEAENGEQALMMIRQYKDSLAAILLDLVMPVKDGYQVMSEMTQNGLMTKIPVIVITSVDSMENEVRAFDLGAADIIIKPFESHVVRRRVQNAVELNRHKMHLEEMVEEQAAKLRESRDVIMDTLSSIIEHRSVETGQHVLRIRMFTKVLLEEVMKCCPEYELNEHSIRVISEAAALHDIGKISIPDTILNKPGRLTKEEFDIMKTHTVKGCEILSGLDRVGDDEYLRYAYNICRYHHERWDGRGYPDGLKGDNTPICAQVVGIADAFDALTTDRVYKRAIEPEKAMTMILNGECGVFSPKTLECLKNVKASFFELAREYADGHSPKLDFAKSLSVPSPLHSGIDNMYAQDQIKYFAMLRYVDSTVFEIDLDSGIYHLVYQQNDDFQALKTGNSFEEAVINFVESSVHPNDRELVLDILKNQIDNFFSHGLIKSSTRYRVFHRASGKYVWYEAAAVRVNIENPKSHKALIVWRLIDEPSNIENMKPEKSGASVSKNLPAGILQCMNDQYFTVTYINEGFISLFGYSKEEIKEKFQNRYIDLVLPEDHIAVRHWFNEQLSLGSTQELEYRVKTKDGRTVWILDKSKRVVGEDGNEYLNCVLTDITQIKQSQEELRLTMERYRIIQDQTNDIIFEGDIESGEVKFSNNWKNKFGYEPISGNIFTQIKKLSHIFPDDIPALQKIMQKVIKGVPYAEAELRIAGAEGKYIWCRIRMTTQFDDSGKAVKAVGVILDIDSEKRRIQELSDRAQKDALTKLYNKETAVQIIQNRLERNNENKSYAMLIIDIDNFKQINDYYGHMFGDAILAESAFRLTETFNNGDIIARFGGDEFLVFIECSGGLAVIEEVAQRVVETFRNIYLSEFQKFGLTTSIGISIYPNDGTDFQGLFKRCDLALYHAKNNGKNQFAVYDDSSMMKSFGVYQKQVSAAGTQIDSDDSDNYNIDSIVPLAFQKLYESDDINEAINSILELVGRRYNVSRVYIFEDSEDGNYVSNTFEWCNDGIEPEIDNLQHISYERMGKNYRDNFDENGIFYCQDISDLSKELYNILLPQGIRSVLQCAVRDGEKFVGFVGFDDCVILRMWTKNQIDALIFISELLSTFLLKKRAQDRVISAARDLRMILDSQNSWIYVLDPHSYELKYINAKIQQIAPEAKLGMKCYRAFYNRDIPCEMCPMNGIKEDKNKTIEIYNPASNIWSMADASRIRWGNQEACLIACHNITDLKTDKN